jgi:predicted Zn-dependent protease
MWNRLWGVAIATSLLVILTQLPSIQAQNLEFAPQKQESPAISTELSSSLPPPQVHPLPYSLAKWQDTTDVSDYFSEVKPTPIGYLIWSQFPVKIYVEQPQNPTESPASRQRFQSWVQAVLQAVQEWSVYLPLEVVNQTQGADITILRSRPPLRTSIDPKTGRFNNIRARSAEARYKFYLHSGNNSAQEVLSHQVTIELSPDQTVDYTLATARHEIGHALGIWGHSPLQTDTMYYSQVRNSPQISIRDINTLKRIYQQPTRVGWPFPFVSPSNLP